MKTITNFTRIKRTIEVLKCQYPSQRIPKRIIIRKLSDADFQTIYINY
jgi:hypothetical protein